MWVDETQCLGGWYFSERTLWYKVSAEVILFHFHYISIGAFSDLAFAHVPSQQPIKS